MPPLPSRWSMRQSLVLGAPAEEAGAPPATRTRDVQTKGACGAVYRVRALGVSLQLAGVHSS